MYLSPLCGYVANLVVQCKASKGIEWIQLRLPETFESGVGIDRKLPVLE
jgi:hypothetical protein